MLDLALALGVSKRNRLSDAIILALFSNNEQGAYYDPYDLTDEKMAWRRNLLLWSEDFSKSPWMSIHVFVETTDVPAPNGGYATKVTKGEGTALRLQALDVNTSNQQTKSIYARTVTGTGTVALLGIAWDSKNVRTLTEQWQRFDIPVELADAGGSTFYAVDFRVGTLTEVLIADAQLDKAELTPYQKITNFNSDFMAQFPNHTLFQDSLGTIPVTGNMQPLGLVLDKRFGGVRGENLWGDLNQNYQTTSAGAFSFSGSNLTIINVSGSSNGIFKTVNVTPDTSYMVVAHKVGGGPSLRLSINDGGIYVVNGDLGTTSGSSRLSMLVTPTQSLMTIGLQVFSGTSGASLDVDFLEVRQILGNHAHQPVSAARPLWQNNNGIKTFYRDGVDDALNITLPAATYTRIVANTGTGYATNTIVHGGGALNILGSGEGNSAGYILIDRALTPTEAANVETLFNKRAGV